MATAAGVYTYGVLRLPKWGYDAPLAQEGTAQYFPVRPLCEWLEIDARSQREKLRSDSRYEDALREIPFLGTSGWRSHLCIRRAELGLWFAGMDVRRVSAHVRGRLDEFQRDLMAEAQRLLFGAAPLAPVGERGQVTYQQREEIRFACIECGAVHRILIENGVVTVLSAGNDGGEP